MSLVWYIPQSTNVVRRHNNRIVDTALHQKGISDAAICIYCKFPKSELQLWQNDSQRAGLKETLFLQCSLHGSKTFLDSSEHCSDKKGYSEINVRYLPVEFYVALKRIYSACFICCCEMQKYFSKT